MAIPSVEQIRSIGAFRANHLWNVQFPDSPFKDWFPATSVTDPTAELSTLKVEGFMNKYEIPESGFSSPRTVSLTFYDAEDLRLYNWLENWINVEILNNGRGVTPVMNCLKTMLIARLTAQGKAADEFGPAEYGTLYTASYQVFPKGILSFDGKSGSQIGLSTYAVEFVVVQRVVG